MQIGPKLLEMRELLATFKYRVGQKVKHVKTGKKYTILGACYIEKDTQAAYLYSISDSSVIFCRPQTEMEDGRFSSASKETPESGLSNFLNCPE